MPEEVLGGLQDSPILLSGHPLPLPHVAPVRLSGVEDILPVQPGVPDRELVSPIRDPEVCPIRAFGRVEGPLCEGVGPQERNGETRILAVIGPPGPRGRW